MLFQATKFVVIGYKGKHMLGSSEVRLFDVMVLSVQFLLPYSFLWEEAQLYPMKRDQREQLWIQVKARGQMHS